MLHLSSSAKSDILLHNLNLQTAAAMPAPKPEEPYVITVNGKLIPNPKNPYFSKKKRKHPKSSKFIYQIFRPKTLLVKTTDCNDTSSSTESSLDDVTSEDDHTALIEKTETLKKEQVNPNGIETYDGSSDSEDKCRVKMRSKRANISTMRFTIRQSICSNIHYQKLLREVMKKHRNHPTILNEKCFDYLSGVFKDMFRIEKLSEMTLALISEGHKHFTGFSRPKNFVQLATICKKSNEIDWKYFPDEDKKYFSLRRRKTRQVSQTARKCKRPPVQKLITSEQLVEQLSQPPKFKNHIYSDDEDDLW